MSASKFGCHSPFSSIHSAFAIASALICSLIPLSLQSVAYSAALAGLSQNNAVQLSANAKTAVIKVFSDCFIFSILD
ncbi:hypothetical protein A6J76_007520 [Aggregatibacter aphrophilus]|nr:hypothetical protein A6J76_007520 [Aggregatibacter aphrophilus]